MKDEKSISLTKFKIRKILGDLLFEEFEIAHPVLLKIGKLINLLNVNLRLFVIIRMV